jgi:hypothetical protein
MTSSASSTHVITDANITPENAEAHADVSRSASFLFLGSLPILPMQFPHLIRRLLAVVKKMNQVVIPAAEAFYHGLNHGEVLSTFSPKNTTNYSSRSKRLRKRLPFNVLIIVLCNCINNCKDCTRQKDPYYQSMDNPAAESPRSRMHQSYRTAPRHPNNHPITEALRN